MGICFDCIKKVDGEELDNIRQAAKQKAIQDGETQAIYYEGGNYYYTSARIAVEGGLPILEFVSQHH